MQTTLTTALLLFAFATLALTGCQKSRKDLKNADTEPHPRPAIHTTANTPMEEIVDAEKAERAMVVLRVRLKTSHGGSKYQWDEVEVLEVIENKSGREIENPLQVASYSWNNGMPAGECTIYLEPYRLPEDDLWKLLEADGAVGASHLVAEQP